MEMIDLLLCWRTSSGAKMLTNVPPLSNVGGSCVLQPHAIHIGFYGLLTLVYDDFFPQPLTDVKSVLASSELPLSQEDFRSKFPKTNLAALEDGCDDFSLDQLQLLQNLCETYSRRLRSSASACKVPVAVLSLVQYSCRCLERVNERRDFSLSSEHVPTSRNDASSMRDSVFMISLDQTGDELHGLETCPVGCFLTITKVSQGLASKWNAENPPLSVRLGSRLVEVNGKRALGDMVESLKKKVVLNIGVLQEPLREMLAGWCLDLPAYLPLLSNAQKRIGNYRTEFVGTTLVIFLSSSVLFSELAAFQSAVNKALLGRYNWFETSSLHCTLRALDFQSSCS